MLNYTEKRRTILKYGNKYGSKTLVETGTFLGETVAVLRSFFERVYTIELQPELADKAKERFKNENSVEVIQGNSAVVLAEIVPTLAANTLFWLDAHYSTKVTIGKDIIETAKAEKDTPILEELEVILNGGLRNNVILIDDARLFIGENDYPTLLELKQFLVENGVTKKSISVKNDIIRITPIQL